MDSPDIYGNSPRQLFSVTKAIRLRTRTFTSNPSLGALLNHGGWNYQREASEFDIDYCGIAQLDGRSISGETFIREYLMVGRPVVLRGAALDWKFRRTWTKKELRKLNARVEVGQIPYQADFGGGKKTWGLREYIAYLEHASETNITEPDYIFGPEFYYQMKDSNALWGSIPEPPSFLQMGSESILEQERQIKEVVWDEGVLYQFYLGPAYSGAPFHFHNDAWDTLAFGKKRWFLPPPPLTASSPQSRRPAS